MNISPGLCATYAALAWTALSIPASILIGRMIRLADSNCPCCGDDQ